MEGFIDNIATPKMRTLVLLWLLLAVRAYGATEGLGRAEQQYQRTEYRQALSTLLILPAKDAAVYALIGKAYYMDGDYRNSTAFFEKALAGDPRNSSYYDWLGRAYGRRAETANFLSAFKYANRTRESFEKAVALDPASLEALSDLFEYYLQAPAIVGGGMDKAEGVAGRIGRLDEAEYHYARARIAEKRHDLRLGEQELRTAVGLAPHQVGRVIDLARFLAKQARYEESDELFRRAGRIAPDSPRVVFERAATYIQSGRNLELAKDLLRQYTKLPISPDDPPRSEGARLLAKASR